MALGVRPWYLRANRLQASFTGHSYCCTRYVAHYRWTNPVYRRDTSTPWYPSVEMHPICSIARELPTAAANQPTSLSSRQGINAALRLPCKTYGNEVRGYDYIVEHRLLINTPPGHATLRTIVLRLLTQLAHSGCQNRSYAVGIRLQSSYRIGAKSW